MPELIATATNSIQQGLQRLADQYPAITLAMIVSPTEKPAQVMFAAGPLAKSINTSAWPVESVQVRAHCDLIDQHGRVFGQLIAWDIVAEHTTTDKLLEQLQLLAPLLAAIWCLTHDRQQTRQELQSLQASIWTDSLTGLLNRRGWEESTLNELQRAQRHGYDLGIIALDLDRLKPINDQQGYQAGDQLLQRTARVLKQTMRAEDLLTRWGGDEFAILVTHCDLEHLPNLLQRIDQELRAAQVAATFGWSAVGDNLNAAWQQATNMLREQKQQRQEYVG